MNDEQKKSIERVNNLVNDLGEMSSSTRLLLMSKSMNDRLTGLKEALITKGIITEDELDKGMEKAEIKKKKTTDFLNKLDKGL